MADLLARVVSTNETWLRKLASAKRVRGVIFPTNPTALPTSVFVLPRLGLRTRLHEPVKARELYRDPFGRTLLVAEHDGTLQANERVSRTYALFQMTEQVSWQRRAEAADPVTKQKVAAGQLVEKGPIWVSIESYTHGNEDPGLRVPTDRLRAITAAPLVLGDVLKGKTVKRVNVALGVTIAEIE